MTFLSKSQVATGSRGDEQKTTNRGKAIVDLAIGWVGECGPIDPIQQLPLELLSLID